MTLATEIRELQLDVIVECYLDAKYYHYDPVEIVDLVEYNATVANQHCDCGECRV